MHPDYRTNRQPGRDPQGQRAEQYFVKLNQDEAGPGEGPQGGEESAIGEMAESSQRFQKMHDGASATSWPARSSGGRWFAEPSGEPGRVVQQARVFRPGLMPPSANR